MNFRHFVKKILTERKLKIVDLSRLSGISYPYCAELIKGRKRWNEDTINKTCKALGIEIEFKDKLSRTG